MNILAPRSEPYPEHITAVLDRYPRQHGYLLELFRVFAQSPRFLTRCVPNLLDGESPLSLRERELVILRTCSNRDCEYEWGVHVAIFGRAADWSEQQIAATRREDPSAGCWTARESLLLEVVDRLCADGRLGGEDLRALRSTWSVEEQLEIFALCGTYQTISYVANHAEMDLESFAARFPTVAEL